MSDLSCGQELLHKLGITQGVCFSASLIPKDKRLEWSDSFPKTTHRNSIKKLKESSVFLVISQDCDIACHNDIIDTAIELIVCKKIKEKDVYNGNLFVKSVRKFHFQINNDWFEANVDYILTVDKADLLETIDKPEEFALLNLPDEYRKSLPLWRANRYLRSALPDKFNESFDKVFDDHLVDIIKASNAEGEAFSSYIRAIYISLYPTTESDNYSFELFALMRTQTPNDVLSKTQDKIEGLSTELVNKFSYVDQSDMYADRDSNTTISYLDHFVKLNLDYHSLSNNDDDVGPDSNG